MPKAIPEMLPVFVNTGTYSRREPASAGDAISAIIEHALLLAGFRADDEGGRELAALAVLLFIHQVQARFEVLAHVTSRATFDAMREAEKAHAPALIHALQDGSAAIAKFLETEAERAEREEREKRDYMRDRLPTEAALTPPAADNDGEAPAAEAA